jgi:ribosomal protein S18 acetylase RimI-like enzyme
MTLEIVAADFARADHGKAILDLLDAYALDSMGGGEALSSYVRENLLPQLAQRPGACVVLAFVDRVPAGLVICFEGFSTFACKPLLNIHDVVVASEFRGKGLAGRMLARVEAIARQRGCCKLTLEVLEGNTAAQSAYRKLGFSGYQLDPRLGKALFWEKKL